MNHSGERFCGNCGARLAPAAEEGERKQLTVLFADVQGSMDLQQDMDPEAWAQIMGRLVGILAEGVRRFGGTVDTFTGDGIMALFGAPVAQEDHAQRGCRAALYLAKAITGYAGQLRSTQDIDLGVRLGLSSGEVLVGRVGDDLALHPTPLGHTVGLAQRMQAMAEPGTAYLSEHTARLVEGWFRLRDVGPVPVKGVRAPVRVFVLEGPPVPPSGLRGGTALGTAPLVGRERELAFLDDALGKAARGQAQVVGVVGEAGVGKSRLCEEFARSAAARGITVRRSGGVSHGRDVPLLPVLALLRNYFGVTEADDPAAAREKVTQRVLGLDPSLGEDLPLLLDFLEVPDPARPAAQLAPEVRMRRIFATVRQLIKRRSEQEVLVLLVEDLHWFDAQSEAFLDELIESYPGSRTLVLVNFRPGFSARWMRHSYYRQIPLPALGGAATGELPGGLLGADLSLAALPGFVQERTGGNPFFVEEVMRTLVEDGTLQGVPGRFRLTRPLREVQVPASVQAVVAARIDRLPAGHKSLLQTAAVIGPTFSSAVLAAGRYLEAARWSIRAGSWAQRTDLAEARRRWQLATDLLAKTDQTPESLELGVRARMRLMQFGARTGIAAADSERLFGEARDLAERLGDTRLLATMMFFSGTPLFTAGMFGKARTRWWHEATGLADATEDPALITLVGFTYGCMAPSTGPLAHGLERVDRALAACEGDVERWIDVHLYSPLARLYQFRASLLAWGGRLTQARESLDRCLTLARTRAEPETLAWALALSSHLVWLTGEGDDTSAAACEAVRIGEDTGNVAALVLGLESLAVAHLTQGRIESAARACEQVLARAEEQRFVQARVLAHLARARLAAGEQDRAAAAATEAVEVAGRQGAGIIECVARLTRAQVGRAIGRDSDTVTADLDAAAWTAPLQPAFAVRQVLIAGIFSELRFKGSDDSSGVCLGAPVGAWHEDHSEVSRTTRHDRIGVERAVVAQVIGDHSSALGPGKGHHLGI